MRPARFSAAHTTEDLAELVCSNSLRSDQIGNAVGLLHEEMRRLDSLILQVADATRVPAGRALAVDRTQFARGISARVEAEPRIEIVREEVTKLPDGPTIVATGPLTSDELAAAIGEVSGEYLYFYDSISPTVYADSINTEIVFRASRYDEGEGDYLNVPLDREQYYAFVDEIRRGDKVPLHQFEKALYFEGCLPIEVQAERGVDTLSYGPMKPVGLTDPRTGKRPFAVIQLRQEDKAGALYNLVGFQTKLRIGEQKRIFRTLPGLEEAVFARFGSAHRNTFLRSPVLLDERLQHKQKDGLYFAGQIAGVEGYVESAALGLLAGIYLAFRATGREAPLPPPTTALGALRRHLSEGNPESFQPMNVNFGLFPAMEDGVHRRKRERAQVLVARALEDLEPWRASVVPE